MMRHRPTLQRGFYTIPALFLLVVIAGLGVFLAHIDEVTKTSQSLAVLRERARLAAKSGMEWAIHQITTAKNLNVCGSPAVSTSFSLTGGALEGFALQVVCDDQMTTGFDEGAQFSLRSHLQVTASKGTPFSPEYVSATLSQLVMRGHFSDNSDGTVTESISGLVLLKDPTASTCPLVGTAAVWSTADTSVGTLASGQCGLSDSSSAGHWRLPTDQELAILLLAKNKTTLFVTDADVYWGAVDGSNAWTVTLSTGSISSQTQTGPYPAWPVR